MGAELTRRGILAGLLALPFVRPLARAAQAIKRKLWPAIYVGEGQSHATLASALQDIEPGGTIYVLPGHTERISETIELGTGISIIGGAELPK